MDAKDIPDWATRVFCERANLNYERVFAASDDASIVLRSAVRAGASLIAQHEQPPVDPLERVLMAFCPNDRELYDRFGAAETFRRELAEHGLQIVEVGK